MKTSTVVLHIPLLAGFEGGNPWRILWELHLEDNSAIDGRGLGPKSPCWEMLHDCLHCIEILYEWEVSHYCVKLQNFGDVSVKAACVTLSHLWGTGCCVDLIDAEREFCTRRKVHKAEGNSMTRESHLNALCTYLGITIIPRRLITNPISELRTFNRAGRRPRICIFIFSLHNFGAGRPGRQFWEMGRTWSLRVLKRCLSNE